MLVCRVAPSVRATQVFRDIEHDCTFQGYQELAAD